MKNAIFVFALITATAILFGWAGYTDGKQSAVKIEPGFYYANENGEIIAYPVSKFDMQPYLKGDMQQVTNGSEPGTQEASYTVIRGTEDGLNYSYSVILNDDQEAYDFLTKAELDTVLAGGYLTNNERLTGE